jgi:adenylate cyclase
MAQTLRIFLITNILLLLFGTFVSAQTTFVADSLERALKQHSGDDDTRVDILLDLSEEYAGYDLKRAKSLLDEANELALKIAYLKGQAKAAYRYAHLARSNNEVEKIFQYADQGQLLAKECNDPNIELKGERVRIAYFLSVGQLDTAGILINKGLEQAKTLHNSLERGIHLKMQGVLFLLKSDRNKSIEVLREAATILKAHRAEVQLCEVYLNLGRSEYELGNKSTALELYQSGIDLAIKNNRKDLLIRFYNFIGITYEDTKDFEKAIDMYNKSLQIATEEDNKFMQAQSYEYLGVAHLMSKKYEKAIEYLEKGIPICKRINANTMLMYFYSSLGSCQIELGKINQAKENIQLALELNKNIHDVTTDYQVWFHLGRIADLENNTSAAIQNWERAYTYILPANNLMHIEQVTEQLADAYAKTGNYKKAFEYKKIAATCSDSLFVIGKDQTIRELQRNHELDTKNREIEFQKSQIEAREATINQQKTLQYALIFGLLLAAVLAYIWRRAYKLRTELNRQIKAEKKIAESLLLNILPAQVAQELTEKKTYTARSAAQVTVICTDFIGFTSMSETLSPENLVDLIDEYFREFDQITGHFNVEKIKTMGDAWMGACGLTSADNPDAVVQAALEIQKFMHRLKALKIEANLPYFDCRIGIHTGPVVAGIVGIRKFAYDIWGDTVNTATRMEQYSEPGRVNISATTQKLLTIPLQTTWRGEIEVKGKGNLGMYFVD